MTPVAWLALAFVAVAAGTDWVAVSRRDRRIEAVAKPAATLALVVLAVAVDPQHDARRAWFVVALVCSLAGDVLLFADRFVPGLASFLAAHVAYVVGFWVEGAHHAGALALGAVAVAVALVLVGRRVVRGDVAVGLYMVVIAAMVVSASSTAAALAVAGAWAFLVSDSVLAWNRFVRPLGWAPVTVMVTYHLAQTALVLSLV